MWEPLLYRSQKSLLQWIYCVSPTWFMRLESCDECNTQRAFCPLRQNQSKTMLCVSDRALRTLRSEASWVVFMMNIRGFICQCMIWCAISHNMYCFLIPFPCPIIYYLTYDVPRPLSDAMLRVVTVHRSHLSRGSPTLIEGRSSIKRGSHLVKKHL